MEIIIASVLYTQHSLLLHILTVDVRHYHICHVLTELGAEEDYELVSYNPYAASDDERQWYVDYVHPHGTVPAMVDDCRGGAGVMLESAAICMCLAERHGRLLPQPDAVSDYLESVSFHCISVSHYCRKCSCRIADVISLVYTYFCFKISKIIFRTSLAWERHCKNMMVYFLPYKISVLM